MKTEIPSQSSIKNYGVETEDEQYDEEECKRVLRSHKLKIVVLQDFAAQEEEARLTEKKSKKRKKEKKEKAIKEKDSRKHKEQLYPQPLTSFSHLRRRYEVSMRLEENILAQGYSVPTEVQLAALPLLLESHTSARKDGQPDDEIPPMPSSDIALKRNIDLLTVAPTGSGKTMAFLIPIINALLTENKTSGAGPHNPTPEGPRAIIVAPTRELAYQIVNEARKLTRNTGIKAALMKKGMEVVQESKAARLEDESGVGESSSDESAEASDVSPEPGNKTGQLLPSRRKKKSEVVKAAILVTTPGALLHALKRTGGDIATLPSVRHLVLDEADVLLDPLFRDQTLSIWNACINPSMNITLWSATMGSNIEDLVISTLNNRWNTLETNSPTSLPRRPPLIRLIVGLKDTAIPNVQHKLVYAATEQGKLLGLRQLLHPSGASSDSTPTLRPPFLVFTQTIPRAVALHSELLYDIPPEAGGSSRIAVLHADLSSNARENIMTRFRRGEVWVLITTDLLARGVDFRGLNGVVNYDVPNSAAAYIHRVGRTGRAGREGGVAVTFYTQEDIPYVKNVANVIRASEQLRGKAGDEGEIKQWLLDALPTPSKRDRQRLKKRGVEVRRTVKDEDGRGKMRISTKSGYDRRVENNRRGAVEGSRRRLIEGDTHEKGRRVEDDSEDDGEFEGFGDE
jgi:ATP-dependent RNA helicase DDX52/ROK1